MKLHRIAVVLLLLFAASQPVGAAALTVFPLFSDHGILQQDSLAPIWGTASRGAAVTVTYCGVTATATADSTGKWLARLKTPKAEPGKDDGFDLGVSSPDGQITLHDVVVGEVWIGSGQSNIDTMMTQYVVWKAEIPKADIPGVRIYSSNPGRSVTGDFSKLHWDRCSPETVGKASAAGYFFSRELHKALNVPVGFINMAVGGSPLSAWTLPEWLASDPRTATNFETFKTVTYPAFIADRKVRLAAWQAASDAAKAKGEKPTPPYPPFLDAADEPLEHFIGGCYVTHTANVFPFVFKGMLWDQGEAGVGYALKGNYDVIFDVMLQHLRKGFGYELPVVYCQMPKGGAWGPTVHEVDKASFAQPISPDSVPLADLPVEAPKAGPVFDGFANEADAFLRMNALPSCYMATTRDLQAALHPYDKDEYGARFCRVALNKVYGRDIESFGPMITSAKREGADVRVSFDHIGGGLVALGSKPLQGFYVSDSAGHSSWATCRIDGDHVVLGGQGLATATTVSYANIAGGRVLWANLFNHEGLPAFAMTVKIE